MRRRRSIVLILTLLLLLTPWNAARADTSAAFTSPAFIATYGKEATVAARLFSGNAITWTLKTSEGDILSEILQRGSGGTVYFHFSVPDTFSPCTTLQLCSSADDRVLCETLLFCDHYQNEGLRRVARPDRKMAITFDSATSPAMVMDILDLLDEYDAKCTFFVIGRFVEFHPEEAAAIVARGHELASHSYEHLEMETAEPEDAYASLRSTEELIRQLIGDQRVLYRPPSGLSTFRDRAIARGMGSEVILWSVDSGDGFHDKSEQNILYRVNNGLHNGGIMLMHIYGGHTIPVLKIILPQFQAQGYSFVTVSDLLLDDAYIDAYGSQRPLHHDPVLFPEGFFDALGEDRAQIVAPDVPPIQGQLNGIVPDVTVGEGLYRANIRYPGDWSFVVWAFDGQDHADMLVSSYKNRYAGSVPLFGQGPYTFDVESYSNWSIDLEPIGVTDETSFTGHGDTVTDRAALPSGEYRLTHRGSSNFLVWAYTTAGEQLLTSHLGADDEIVTVDVPEGSRIFFVVRADGSWTISPAE